MRSSLIEEHLLVLLKEVGRLKEFGPLRFTLKNLICDTETYWKDIRTWVGRYAYVSKVHIHH